MTVGQIYAYIRKLAHDKGRSETDINMAINQALAHILTMGYLNDQIITDETVTVADGTTAINTANPVKSVLACSADYTDDSEGLRLTTAVVGDTDITISYVTGLIEWDGTEATNVYDSWLYIYGAVYFIMIHNMAQETPLFEKHFLTQIGRVFGDDALLDNPDALSSEVFGL